MIKLLGYIMLIPTLVIMAWLALPFLQLAFLYMVLTFVEKLS